MHPDGNSHIRLHQQALPINSDILINDLRVGSQLQEDLYQLWLESQRRILPVTIHRDEAMAECLAAKQPLGSTGRTLWRRRRSDAGQLVSAALRREGGNDSPEHPTAGAAGRETAERALSRLSPARRVAAGGRAGLPVGISGMGVYAAGNAALAGYSRTSRRVFPHINPHRPRPLDPIRYLLQCVWLLATRIAGDGSKINWRSLAALGRRQGRYA